MKLGEENFVIANFIGGVSDRESCIGEVTHNPNSHVLMSLCPGFMRRNLPRKYDIASISN